MKRFLIFLFLTITPIISSAGIIDASFGADLEGAYYNIDKGYNDNNSEDSVSVYRANLRLNNYFSSYFLLDLQYVFARNSLAKLDKEKYIQKFHQANVLIGEDNINLKLGRMHYNEREGGDYLIYYGTHSITYSPFITSLDGTELNAKFKIFTLNGVYGIDENEYYDETKTDAKISGLKLGINIKEQIKLNTYLFTKKDKTTHYQKEIKTPGIELEYNGNKNNFITSYTLSKGTRKSILNTKDYDGDAVFIKYSRLEEGSLFDTKLRLLYAKGSGENADTSTVLEKFEPINPYLELGEIFLNRDSLKNFGYLRQVSTTYGLQANSLANLKVENIGVDISTKFIKGFTFSLDIFNFNVVEPLSYITPSTELGQELNASLKYFYKDLCLKLFYAKFEDGEASKAVYSPNIGSTIQKSGLTVTYNFN
ncbi:MAG: hypothetical protein HOF07_01965 [Elusimicrobiaceae bacterium]|nr:hypothetical protein [Elusimicrobiaceae bacterium]